MSRWSTGSWLAAEAKAVRASKKSQVEEAWKQARPETRLIFITVKGGYRRYFWPQEVGRMDELGFQVEGGDQSEKVLFDDIIGVQVQW